MNYFNDVLFWVSCFSFMFVVFGVAVSSWVISFCVVCGAFMFLVAIVDCSMIGSAVKKKRIDRPAAVKAATCLILGGFTTAVWSASSK